MEFILPNYPVIIMKHLKLCLFLFFLLFLKSVGAQNYGCYDSLLVSPGAYCAPDYEPVCACNQKTYRNYCFANIEGYQQYENGICEIIGFDFTPNPVFNSLEIKLFLRNSGNVNMYVMDLYGKIYYKTSYWDIVFTTTYLDVSNYEQGVYLIFFETGGEFVVKKFVKIVF